ncbi:MAG: hypothetical protein LUK37_20055 [Clostridia bacterium]|nr:hypothetical protein [Clostridia bacterium]
MRFTKQRRFSILDTRRCSFIAFAGMGQRAQAISPMTAALAAEERTWYNQTIAKRRTPRAGSCGGLVLAGVWSGRG